MIIGIHAQVRVQIGAQHILFLFGQQAVIACAIDAAVQPAGEQDLRLSGDQVADHANADPAVGGRQR